MKTESQKLIGKLDTLFSQYVRLLEGGYCRRCGKYLGTKSRGYHCCHYKTRAKHSVRWDRENVTALCYGCHRFIDHPNRKLEKDEFFRELLGQERFNKLNERAERLFPKVDKEALIEFYKEKLKELDSGSS